ncbi:SWIM zinc finger family protein [Streptomyces showdoensis]|uniref:SWIM zinc finger domain protein n=1 Tax=Streptomyces showdoensis TaxID=68268 RepID=A0A2P2GU70_STREW|nr:SWIM zinc finger family protein [Streptomyces showdoensis]KKZ75043.1 SWIM zinc finger domain protein [Streptomyces showdoensis]
MSTELLPPVAPDVLADAVEQLSARLRKKLDAAIASCGGQSTTATGGTVEVHFGEDTKVTLRPGPSGVVTGAEQAVCSCLLSPRCLHRAAVLGAAPLAEGQEDAAEGEPSNTDGADPLADDGPGTDSTAEAPAPGLPSPGSPLAETASATLTPAQVRAATALWTAAAEALSAGVTAGGAVVQAELLRAAHTARLAALPRAEAAALRVVRGLRAARERSGGQRLGDLADGFRELLAAAALLSSGSADAGAAGSARRAYEQGGSLRVYGLCREPVLSATGYGGVTTHLVGSDGEAYTVSDVRPGGLARVKGAGSASVALGGAVLDHAGLARGGLRIVGATVSADGRLGAGRGVSATPLRGADWSEDPAAALFARPVREAMAAALADDATQSAERGRTATRLLGCDVEVIGAVGDFVLVRVAADGPLLRLRPAHPHPELPHAANLRRIAEHPGLVLRVLGRPDLDRAATLRPLAVGPVPEATATLRLPDEWKGHADLGYDRLQGEHFPREPIGEAPADPLAIGPDPLADAPLWRVRRLLETGVAGGRRAVAEAGRGTDTSSLVTRLTRAGLGGAAHLAQALTTEAGRRPRDPFGRLTDPSADAYARAWLAAAVHLSAAERTLVAASWS